MSRLFLTRRGWLQTAVGASAATILGRTTGAAEDTEVRNRTARIVREYEQQGFHRTGSQVDGQSADWLSREVRAAGLTPSQEAFSLDRVDLASNVLIVGDRRIDGLALFDGPFTDVNGIVGHLGPLGSDAEIGLGETRPNAAATGDLGT